eukprot:8005046-Lingulodinium_polyedra.AAC.1
MLREAKVEGEHIRIMTPQGTEVSVVKVFKRVGFWRHAGGGHKEEIRHRQQAAYEALWKIRKSVLEARRAP